MDAVFIRDLIYFVVYWFSRLLTIAIFIRVICSWLPFRMPEILFLITEPILSPVRKMFQNSPLGGSMIDFSPIISLFLIQIIANLILGAL